MLTELEIRNAKPGLHADGNGLYLQVAAEGHKSWIYRFQLAGRRREMGLGALVKVPVKKARAAAAIAHAQVVQGIDPIETRKADKRKNIAEIAATAAKAVTFRKVAAAFIADNRAGWRNAKHVSQWENTLETYAGPVIGDTAVGDVDADMVLKILRPIWETKPETASRVRGRIEAVLDYAKAMKWRDGENPARWRGHLAKLLPERKRVKAVQHHPALSWRDLPAFMTDLSECEGVAARALEFAILTAARSGEVRLAQWSEIHAKTATWSVPAERMKARRTHNVPLSKRAMALLDALRRVKDEPLIFPGTRLHRPLSDMTLTAVLRRMERGDITVHGFRSTFRDWCAEATEFPSEAAELALAHVVGDKVEAAYRRGDMLERRRALMDAWAAWCYSGARKARRKS